MSVDRNMACYVKDLLMNIEEVLFEVEDYCVCSMLDLSGSVSGSNAAAWTGRIHEAIYSGNGCGTKAPHGCAGCTPTFPERDDMKIYDGCADDLFAEQNK